MINTPASEPVDPYDPALTPHQLQALAQSHPQHWNAILQHPNVYQGLSEWIRARQSEQVTKAYEPEELQQDDAAEVATSVEAEQVDEAAEVEAVSEAPEAVEPQTQVEEPLHDDVTTPEPEHNPEQESAPELATPQQPSVWAAPSGASQPQVQPQAQPQAQAQPTQQYQQQAFQQPAQPQQGQAQHGQPHGQPSYGQQFVGAPPQNQPWAYSQPMHQPAQYRAPAGPAFAGRNPWGPLLTGGAAFLGLFGFLFSPSHSLPGLFGSHLSAGGGLILLAFLATVTLAVLKLFKPLPWVRFFFITVSFGAGFAMIGRTMAYIGALTMRHTNFSVVWLLFMSLLMIAGAMITLAPSRPHNSFGHYPPQTQMPGQYAAYQQQAPQQYSGGQQPHQPLQQPGQQSGPAPGQQPGQQSGPTPGQ